MTLDTVNVWDALYRAIKSDAAGAAVRALLGAALAGGNGADSVITVERLRADVGAKGRLPPCPLLAWQAGPIGGSADEMRPTIGYWWIYDDPGRGDRRIGDLITVVAAAYSGEDVEFDLVPYGRVRPGPVGQPAPDRALGLYGCAMQIIHDWRA